MNLNSLSIQEKVGQKFMFGINSHNIDIIIDLIKKYHIGGVILYKKNYDNYDEMLSVIKRLKDANRGNKLPLFIAIDQEGGRVNRMPSEFKNIKNIYDMSKKNKDLLYDNGNITGMMLSRMGVNMNFAPVLDICENDAGNVLYKRCFYGDKDDVNDASRKYIKGLNNNNIISVVKHFPGHGISKMDSHFFTPYVRDYNKVLNKHIKPFDNAISNGIDAIMVNHLVIKGLTEGLPASISRNFIDQYIRKRYNFDGLVITDEMNMITRNIIYKFNYMKKVFISGSDIILIKIKDSSNAKIIDKYLKFLNNNSEYIDLLNDSVNRIANIKNKYNLNDDTSYVGCNVEEINNKIEKLNELCL